MARVFKRKERMEAMSKIDITPLLDLAFALLIIFMISTPLLEQSIEVVLPVTAARPQDPRPDDRIQVINIDAQGRIFYGRQGVTLEQLDLLLGELAESPNPPVLSIRADRDLRYQVVVSVLDAVKRNHLTRISLDTQVE